jgi:hypothetical protein
MSHYYYNHREQGTFPFRARLSDTKFTEIVNDLLRSPFYPTRQASPTVVTSSRASVVENATPFSGFCITLFPDGIDEPCSLLTPGVGLGYTGHRYTLFVMTLFAELALFVMTLFVMTRFGKQGRGGGSHQLHTGDLLRLLPLIQLLLFHDFYQSWSIPFYISF